MILSHRIFALCAMLLTPAFASASPAPLSEPLLPKPTLVAVTVELKDFVTLPKHADGSAARPQFLTQAPDGTTDLMIVDEAGVVYRVSADGTRTTPYIDLRAQNVALIEQSGEEGLVGLAFHPNFAGKPALPGYGKFYTAFSAARGSGPRPDFLANDDSDHEQVIREWTASNPRAASFTGTSREVLRVGRFASNHNGGVIRFNPNAVAGTPDYGALYIGFGDGGGGNDPHNNAQNLQSPLGKILRINPLATAAGAKYSIPSDNPFQTVPLAGRLVWAYGLRNPQQFSWEVGVLGRMVIGNIGQNQVESLYVGLRGANYGWQMREGNFATGVAVGSPGGKNDYAVYPLPANDASYGFTYPAAEYDHSDEARDGGTQSAAVGGGFFYQGHAVPKFGNSYLFTDFAQGKLFGVDANPAPLPTPRTILQGAMVYHGVAYTSLSKSPIGEGSRSDFRLGEDASAELYALIKGPGAVYRIVAYD